VKNGTIYLDTHVVVWLYAGRPDLITPLGRAMIDANDVLISPIVALELQYLFEAAKTTEPADPVVQTLAREIGLKRCDLPFAEVVEVSLGETWTRDPFDRLVVAQARLRGAPLLSKDREVGRHYSETIWGEEPASA
jgi:PIN domain nuclease of toxin-antitoxin system